MAQLADMPNPRLSQSVHREECTQCFDNQDLPLGVDVCLSCFNGGCINDDPSRQHAHLHHEKLGHPFSLNVKRKLKPSKKPDKSEPPMKKLAIVEEHEEDKYDYCTTLWCWSCDHLAEKLLQEESGPPDIKCLTTSIMQSLSYARQLEVKAWEE